MEPVVKPLSHLSRKLFFAALFVLFMLALPAFIFYATGYRYDFMSDSPSITATGGLYVITSVPEAGIFVNEAPAPNSRIFRSATYIQGLNAGGHRVHVQVPGTATWVKELTILAHIVTEVESFNLPLVPRVRPVTPYVTFGGVPVVVVATASSTPFTTSTTTVSFIATTSRATSTLSINREYAQINALFIEKASTTKMREELKSKSLTIEPSFGFATGTTPSTTAAWAVPTTTIIQNDVMLYQVGEEVFAKALGEGRDVPVYFCAVTEVISHNSDGEVTQSALQSVSTSTVESLEFAPGSVPRECRTDIRIDRKWQTVKDFMFMPGNVNLVLMQLTDGVYVVEVDDRAWQNVQQLYAGTDLAVIVDGEQIFIKDGENIVEVFTTIVSP